MIATLIVIAKRPVPGRVKTRLVPPLTFGAAASVAGAALTDTLQVVDATPAQHRMLAFDGRVEGWLLPDWLLTAQPAGGLDRRLGVAFAAAPAGPALLVGMDTPQLRPDQLSFDSAHYDACLGPATDGGYWVIGFREPRLAAAAIAGVPMSTPRTAAAQLARLTELGLRVQLLDELMDVDDIAAAESVAAVAPASAFAAALADATRPIVRAG